MPDDAQTDLFPLPLVPFEQYMLRDDTPEYPMTFCFVLDFSGQFDRPAFEEALDAALQRHPLLRAIVERVPKQGDCWVAAPQPRPPLDWDALDVPLESPRGNVIDLRGEVGLRLWMRQSNGHARLTIQFHHACTDGVGVFRFISDLLLAYSLPKSRSGDLASLEPLDPAALRDRGRLEVELPEPVSPWQVLKANVAEGVKFFGRKVTPFAISPKSQGVAGSWPGLPQASSPRRGVDGADTAETTDIAPFPDILLHTFDAATTTALKHAAKQRDATTNDLLLRDVFRLIADWNASRDPRAGRRWIRVNMPTNLRGDLHRKMPAANAISYSFLMRRAADCRDPSGLLDWVRRETHLIKYWSLGLIHLGGLATLVKVPGLFRLMTWRRCMATMVVSNLGDPSRHFHAQLCDGDGRIRSGSVLLERMTGAPPPRPLTRASIVVIRYAGQLTIGLRCDRRYFTQEDAQALLDHYVELLKHSAAASAS